MKKSKVIITLLLIVQQIFAIEVYKPELNGYVHLGPYNVGSNVTLFELNDNLSATGKIFETPIETNEGTFLLKDVRLSSQYAKFKAAGYYFNPIDNKNSSSQLTLYALTDLLDEDSVNVNILTHMEKNRIEYLIENGYSFAEAKQQAQKEILQIFLIDEIQINNSESLSINHKGAGNSALLAVSIIMQGYRNVAELSELAANISNDLREDGTLDNDLYGSQLISGIKFKDLDKIRENLEKRYEKQNIEAVVPAFESYIENFIQNTKYQYVSNIIYPEYSLNGKNVLYSDSTVLTYENHYSLSAEIPFNSSLKIVMKGGLWMYRVTSVSNWHISVYDYGLKKQEFTAIMPEIICDLEFYYVNGDTITIEYYENNSDIPVKRKKVTFDGIPLEETNAIQTSVNRKLCSIYPNPVNSKLNIKTRTRNSYIKIYAFDGKLVDKYYFESVENIELDVNHYTEGLYFVEFTSDKNKTETLKFLKVK